MKVKVKLMNWKQRSAMAAATALVAAGQASAAVPEALTDKLDELQADLISIVTAGGLVVLAIVGVKVLFRGGTKAVGRAGSGA